MNLIINFVLVLCLITLIGEMRDKINAYTDGFDKGAAMAVKTIQENIDDSMQRNAPFYVGDMVYKLWPMDANNYCIRRHDGHSRATYGSPRSLEHRVRGKEVRTYQANASQHITGFSTDELELAGRGSDRPESDSTRVALRGSSSSESSEAIGYKTEEGR